MKSTSPLTILCSASLPEYRFNMHPNEGADLGLMMTRHSMKIGEGKEVDLHLLNECPKESVEVSAKFWESIGRPSKAILSYDGAELIISKV